MTMRSEANLIGAIQTFNFPSEIFTPIIRSVFFVYLGQVIGFTQGVQYLIFKMRPFCFPKGRNLSMDIPVFPQFLLNYQADLT
jgi:hypothetical protein